MSTHLRALLPFAVAMTIGGDARADAIAFTPHDVETVFFVTKSSDRNRVDYGIHLSEHCAPINDSAMFPYWREFEASPPVRTHSLGFLDYIPFGFSEQRLVHRSRMGGDQFMRLKQLPRPMVVTSKMELDGYCSAVARMRIASAEGAILTSIYAKLASAITVEYIDIHGKHPLTGADIIERVYR